MSKILVTKPILDDWEKEMSEEEFISFYYSQFGYDCGSPRAIADSLTDYFTYLGRGYSARRTKPALKQEESGECKHPKKYLNKLTKNLQFMVCPDCKKEVT
jgi:hypothetical protein